MKATTAKARNTRYRNVTDLGVTPRKKQLSPAESQLYGELSYHCTDYRTLPADDPRRMEIERVIASMPTPTKKRPCTAIGGSWK